MASNSFSIGYSAGGEIDKVKKVEYVNGVFGFASFLLPYNTMQAYEIPAIKQVYEHKLVLPDKPLEILGFTVTCTGYGENDWYDLYINEYKIFDHWYTQEVKEGLFIGSSTFVYKTQENTQIKISFNNESATRKILYLGVRALSPTDEQIKI